MKNFSGFQGTDYNYALTGRKYNVFSSSGYEDESPSASPSFKAPSHTNTIQLPSNTSSSLSKRLGSYSLSMDRKQTTILEESSSDTGENLSRRGSREDPGFRVGIEGVEDDRGTQAATIGANLWEQHRRRRHMQSADLYDEKSPTQHYRSTYRPIVQDGLKHFGEASGFVRRESQALNKMISNDQDEVNEKLSSICNNQYIEILPVNEPSRISEKKDKSTIIGVILSGGPAPGGHNVVVGMYDMLMKINPNSKVVGFMGGIDGFFSKRIRMIDEETIDKYRNSGGFDMLWSGRGRFHSDEDFENAAAICTEYKLDGLVIIGGDGSNSNSALIADYLKRIGHHTSVIGVPKTIDGDLKSALIECSFGFDTCSKTYSELIGNLTTDIGSSQQVYHFVRVMGRAASHLVLECALQTRPNLVLIGEEVKAKKQTLSHIVGDIADLMEQRMAQEKRYGLILVPEGLIEFIPEVEKLIGELNSLVVMGEFKQENLSEESLSVWSLFPDIIKSQLLGDREATGYIQVAKIQTERLLILMVEAEMIKRGIDPMDEGLLFMPHYFGYEGRCAMPSNFDCNLCYSLGMTASALIIGEYSGYMACVRHLDKSPDQWQPAGVPLTKLMHVKEDAKGNRYVAVVQQLLKMEDPLMTALNEVRDLWRVEDVYRCPGPIQFDGPVADIANMTVLKPSPKQLLWGSDASRRGVGSWICTKRAGQLSSLQRDRLRYTPPLPESMNHLNSTLVPASEYLPQDPYTLRQILMYFPLLAGRNSFATYEVQSSEKDAKGARMGLLFLSRQSPGVMNVLWGMFDRCKQAGGQLFGFYGMDGLAEGRSLEISPMDLGMFLNQGGCELLGRSSSHKMLYKETREKVLKTVKKMQLDGLVIVGSNLALYEASLLSEDFIEKKCECSVIGIPATGSNNLIHPLLETNIGFDTSSKVYANLIGNVLTEAASMPKYWHFIRLLGRAPSYEVLECALQTHPNMVIIAEEYGSAQKSLGDVVNDIADVVCARSELGKNFGTLLIPDGLLWHLPGMKGLLLAIAQMVGQANDNGESISKIRNELAECEGEAFESLSSYHKELFQALAKHIRKAVTRYSIDDDGGNVETEVLLSEMVGHELKARKERGEYNGTFQTVKHFFGYQGRSSMPSQFDANLSYAYGRLAAMCIESNLTGHCCSIRGLCGPVKQWKPMTISFTSMMKIVPSQQDVHHELMEARADFKSADIPIIPSSEVSLESKSFRWMKTALFQQWMLEDRYCNPGPVQYYGPPSLFTSRSLFEEQAEYYNMLKTVVKFTDILKGACQFGVEPEFLRSAFLNLNSLIMMRFFKDDFTTMLPNVPRLLKNRAKAFTDAVAATDIDDAEVSRSTQNVNKHLNKNISMLRSAQFKLN